MAMATAPLLAARVMMRLAPPASSVLADRTRSAHPDMTSSALPQHTAQHRSRRQRRRLCRRDTRLWAKGTHLTQTVRPMCPLSWADPISSAYMAYDSGPPR